MTHGTTADSAKGSQQGIVQEGHSEAVTGGDAPPGQDPWGPEAPMW